MVQESALLTHSSLVIKPDVLHTAPPSPDLEITDCVVFCVAEKTRMSVWPLHWISFQLHRPIFKNILIFFLSLALEMLGITWLVII